ncbi:hypothetical protein JHW43_006606 [Diplocarpon mali]|nr:hypothetical protein JHW43_006606 [Diplocarpon mali]
MPPRLELLTKCWSTFDLPILPFLAPRVFQACPRNTRRAHSRADPVQQKAGPTNPPAGHDSLSRQSCREQGELRKLQHFKPHSLDKSSLNGSTHDEEVVKDDLPGQLHCQPRRDQEELLNLQQRERESLDTLSSGGSTRDYEELFWNDVETKGVRQRSNARKHLLSAFSDEEGDFWAKYKETWRNQGLPRSSSRKLRKARSAKSTATKLTEAFRVSPLCGEQQGAILRSGRSGHASQKGHQILNNHNTRLRPVSPETQIPKQKRVKIVQDQEWWRGIEQKRATRINRAAVRGLPRIPAKLIRITRSGESDSYSFSRTWNCRFALLNSRYDKCMKDIRLVRQQVFSDKQPRVSRRFVEELVEATSTDLLAEKWKALDPQRRNHLWSDLILKVLEYYPQHALDILMATFVQPYPPGYAIADSLDFIISYFLSDPNISLAKGATIVKAFDYFLTNGPKGHVHFLQRTVYRSMGLLDARFLEELYSTLVAANHPLHENTLLQFGTRSVKLGNYKTACSILQKLKDQGCDFSTSKVIGFYLSLLRQTIQDKKRETHSVKFEIARLLWLAAEVKPNITIYNVLLENALQSGNQKEAWRLHDLMIQSGLQPSEYTYSLLLNDSKLRVDPPAIRKVLDCIRRCDIKNTRIITDILHAILLLHQQERKLLEKSGGPTERQQPAFVCLLPVYLQHFNVEPLARIIPNFSERYLNLDNTKSTDSQTLLRDPPGPTLVVMITAFLDNIPTSLPAKKFYDQFRILVHNNDPVVIPLVHTTHVWNLVLQSFSKFPERLGDCSILIGDMLSPKDSISTVPVSQLLPEETDGFESQPALENDTAVASHGPSGSLPDTSPSSSSPPKPDVFTWSILIKIFMDQQQSRAAEKVLTMMRERGIEPSKVTWNKLAHGYASMQKTSGVVGAVARLEEAGMQADEFTMSALSKIKNRRALIEELRRKDAKSREAEVALMKDLQDNLQAHHEYQEEEVIGARKDAEAVDAGVSYVRDLKDDLKAHLDYREGEAMGGRKRGGRVVR